jgi:hypothetical protein
MPNAIKEVGGGLALQVTKPVRGAGLVEEDAEGDVEYRARVLVHAVDQMLLVVDRDRVDGADRAAVVASAIEYTASTHRADHTRVQPKGHGYMVALPAAEDAGLELGTTAPVHTAPGLLVVTDGSSGTVEVARSLVDLRETQAQEG